VICGVFYFKRLRLPASGIFEARCAACGMRYAENNNVDFKCHQIFFGKRLAFWGLRSNSVK